MAKTIIFKNNNMRINKSWFTLIELIVSITILSIIMISIFAIFKISNDVTNRTEVSRAMQENIKNIVELISEDVRTKEILWLNSSINPSCDIKTDYKNIWNKICFKDDLWEKTDYYIAYLDNVWWNYNRIFDFSDCEIWKKSCVLVKKVWREEEAVSNSWVEFRDFKITLLNNWEKNRKILLNFTIQPSIKKWINSNLIKNNKIVFQTTLSQRLYKSN